VLLGLVFMGRTSLKRTSKLVYATGKRSCRGVLNEFRASDDRFPSIGLELSYLIVEDFFLKFMNIDSFFELLLHQDQSM
jgi:hypothetical protein